MTISAASSPLARALNEKFGRGPGSRRKVLAALGIDESLLSGEAKAPSKFANFAMQLVANAIAPVLAKDAKIDLMPVFKDVTAKSFKAAPLKLALDSALKGKLAADAEAGMGHVAQMLDHIEHVAGEGRDESISPEEHKAMEAAAHGESALGIPKKAGDRKFGWDEETVEKFKDFLRDLGMDENDIVGACDALGLPKNATEGGMGGAFAEDQMRRLAHDSAIRSRDVADLNDRLPEISRVGFVMGDQEVVAPPTAAAIAAISDFARGVAERVATTPF